MPELSQRFEVSGTLMSLIRSGVTCRLSCLELTSEMDKTNLQHRWPMNATLTVNRSHITLQQKHAQDGKIKTKALKERPANIQSFLKAGTNTFRLSGEPNLAHGDWPSGICITLVRQREISELVTRVRERNFFTTEDTRKKIKKLYNADADIVTEKMTVSLKCPLSLKRIKVPARGRDCNHLGCFDVENYLQYQRDARYAQWKCIICNNGPLMLKSIVVDEWMEDILLKCKEHDNVDHIDVYEDGSFVPVFEKKESRKDESGDEDDHPAETRKRKYDESNVKQEQSDSPIPPNSNEPTTSSQFPLVRGRSLDTAIELD